MKLLLLVCRYHLITLLSHLKAHKNIYTATRLAILLIFENLVTLFRESEPGTKSCTAVITVYGRVDTVRSEWAQAYGERDT